MKVFYAVPDAPWQLDEQAEAHTLALVERLWGVLTRCAEAELKLWQTLSREMCVSRASEGVQTPVKGRVLDDIADHATARWRAREARDVALPVLTPEERDHAARVGFAKDLEMRQAEWAEERARARITFLSREPKSEGPVGRKALAKATFKVGTRHVFGVKGRAPRWGVKLVNAH